MQTSEQNIPLFVVSFGIHVHAHTWTEWSSVCILFHFSPKNDGQLVINWRESTSNHQKQTPFLKWIVCTFCHILQWRSAQISVAGLSATTTTRSKHIKDSKERLFIRTQTHNLQIFGVIPFVKLQNNTKTTVKRLKTMKFEMRSEITYLFLVELCCTNNNNNWSWKVLLSPYQHSHTFSRDELPVSVSCGLVPFY